MAMGKNKRTYWWLQNKKKKVDPHTLLDGVELLRRMEWPSKDKEAEKSAMAAFVLVGAILLASKMGSKSNFSAPPQLGVRLLLLILSKEDRENLIGDLEEEFLEIQIKQGRQFAKLWYYKQVLGSTVPLLRKAFRWGLLAWAVEWIRRLI